MIMVDDRAGSAEIAPHLMTSHMLCTLDYADFAWIGNGPEGPANVGVERKTIMDLLQSMTTGRLSGHQLIGLTQYYDFVYLLVEGVWRADKESGVLMRINKRGKWTAAAQGSRRFMARDVFNYLNSLAVLCNVVVITTSSRWETAKWLDSMWGWWDKGWEKHKSHLQFVKPTTHAHLTKPSLVTRIASQFDGIGWDKARAIGEAFPRIWDFMVADMEDLMNIPGIGKVLAKSIIDQRGGSSHEEGT